jgi:hypothetical protein
MKNISNQNIYSQMQRFADITKTLILQCNIQRAKECILIAEEIFYKGTTKSKNAVFNIFVFSVTSFMEIHHVSVKNLFPKSLRNENNKQINA